MVLGSASEPEVFQGSEPKHQCNMSGCICMSECLAIRVTCMTLLTPEYLNFNSDDGLTSLAVGWQ